MKIERLVICLLVVWGSSCLWRNPWKQLSSSDPNFGEALFVKAAASPEVKWNTWVVVQSLSPYPVLVCFRTGDTAKCHERQIRVGDMVALRVGPGDVEFLFRRTSFYQPLPPMPTWIARVSTDELLKRYSFARRF